MRTLLLLCLLGACGEQEAAPPPSLEIACAPDGSSAWIRCAVTRETHDGATILTVTEPEGGFRRLLIDAEGKPDTADGAARALVSSGSKGTVEIAVDDGRYRLPARAP